MRHMKLAVHVALVLIALLVVGVIASAQSADIVDNSSLTGTLQSGVLKVGINPGYAPFEMIDEQGDLIGFDVDISQIMADLMGVKLNLVVVAWEGTASWQVRCDHLRPNAQDGTNPEDRVQ